MDFLLRLRRGFNWIVCFSLLYSCDKNSITGSIEAVSPLNATIEVDDITSYISEIELMPIADIAAGNVSKLIQCDSTLFALSGGVVFRFSDNGEKVSKIGNIGRGPGEYLIIKDISFNLAEDELWCLDVTGKLLKYGIKDCEYIETIDFGTDIGYCNAFIPMSDNRFALYIPNPPVAPLRKDLIHDCIRIYDQNGVFLESGLPWQGFNVVSAFSIPVSYSGNRKYVLNPESSVPSVVYVDGNESESIFFDFENKNLPLDFAFRYKPDAWAAIGDIFEQDFYKVISSVYFLNDARYLHAFGKDSSSWNFYIPDNGKGFRWCSKGLFAPPIFAVGCNKNYLYFPYADYGMTDTSKEPDPLKRALLELLGSHHDEDKSYLIKVKFNVY